MAKFPPVQLQDGLSPEWTCQTCGGDGLWCGCPADLSVRELDMLYEARQASARWRQVLQGGSEL